MAAMLTHVNGYVSTKVTGVLATLFVVEFKDRIREAAADHGVSQAQLAREIKMSHANMTHWFDGRAKNPKGDAVTRAAIYLGVSPLWLASGKGPKRGPTDPISGSYLRSIDTPRYDPPIPASGAPALERAIEVDGVELTKEAIQVAKAFMDLPRNLRDEFKRKIETAALSHSSAIEDGKLRHLAAPARARKKPSKRRAGTQ